jgi:hypothetical protein
MVVVGEVEEFGSAPAGAGEKYVCEKEEQDEVDGDAWGSC